MKHTVTNLAIACMLASGAVASDDYESALKDLANNTIAEWVTDPVVLDVLRIQNVAHEKLTEGEIIALDATWREQVVSGGALVDSILSNGLSNRLREIQAQGDGRYTEIFITDARGLNVGQSDITSDYWQGDEDKWQVPHTTSGIHISPVEFDESSQAYQSQISLPIMDDGTFVGVITVGVDLELLTSAN